MIPIYWQEALQTLGASDPVMASLFDRYPDICLVSRGDPFATLARSIIGQQISVKAADAIWGRFVTAVGQVEPTALLRRGEPGLEHCGLSRRKIEYLLDLAAYFALGHVADGYWTTMDDASVIADLTKVRGIGRWTAEMFLIFNLLRPDVFPLDDIGLQRAVSLHYFAGEKPTRSALAAFGERWRPWRSVATWYLWRSLDPVPVEY